MSVQKPGKGPQQPNNPAMSEALRQAQGRGGDAGQGQPQGGAAPGDTQQSPGGRRSGGIMSINRSMRRPMSRNSSGEQVIKFQEAIRKSMADNMGETFEDFFKLLVLDSNTNNLPLSCLLICYSERVNNVDHVAVYTLIIEGVGSRLANRHTNIAGQPVEIETVAGDVYDSNLYAIIEGLVSETYGSKNLNIHEAGSMVLPGELEPEDFEAIRRVLFNATQACYTIMENNVGGSEEPFNVGFVDQADQLKARLEYAPQDAINAVGLPVRSDLNITLQGAAAAQSNVYFEQVRELTSVDCFVDLVFTPPNQPAYGQRPETQTYTPRVVMTRVDTEVDAITMELELLALSTSTLVSRNMVWAGVFRPRHNVKGIDLRDIGAIGYDVAMEKEGVFKKVDTKGQDFTPQHLYQMLGMYVHQRPAMSMDIEEVGELSWIHQAFIASANGNQLATQMILEAANNLTLGQFQNIYPGGPICQDDNNRIHLGYYTDESGKVRDIRDFDYLAMLNLAGKEDPQVVIDWANTFDQTDVPLEIRLERRWKILQGVVAGKLHLKGYARRVTFNPAFLEALNQACHAAGLVVRPENLIQDFSGQVQRGNPNIQQWGLDPNNTQGMFNYGQGGFAGQGGRMFGTPFTGRFGR